MRIVRLIAVFLGVGLIVAVTAGYLARQAELSRDRDLWVETAAELAAVELDAVVGMVEVTTVVAAEAEGAVGALTAAGLHACAVPTAGPGDVVCAPRGGGLASDPAADDELAPLLDVLVSEPDVTGTTTVRDGMFVVVERGPSVTAAAATPIETLIRSARVSVASGGRVEFDVTPADGVADGVAHTVDDERISARRLGSSPEWMVVAALPDEVVFDPVERLTLGVLLVLAVLLLGLAGFTIVADRRRLVERASIDPLTRLPNRSEFEARGRPMVQQALRNGDGACLMLVDLDGFKDINDTHGHHAGDEVLRVVGMRLRSAVRGYDLVARWGGDEFVVVLPGIDNEVFAESRAMSLAALVAEPMRSDDEGPGLQVGASVGIALLGHHGESLEDLVAAADAAMYAAKRQGEMFRFADADERGNDRDLVPPAG